MSWTGWRRCWVCRNGSPRAALGVEYFTTQRPVRSYAPCWPRASGPRKVREIARACTKNSSPTPPPKRTPLWRKLRASSASGGSGSDSSRWMSPSRWIRQHCPHGSRPTSPRDSHPSSYARRWARPRRTPSIRSGKSGRYARNTTYGYMWTRPCRVLRRCAQSSAGFRMGWSSRTVTTSTHTSGCSRTSIAARFGLLIATGCWRP